MSPNPGNGTEPIRPRQRNQREVLDALLRRPHLTQQGLVQETGLSRATIARIVGTLIDGELVVSERGAESPAGIPVDVLSIHPGAGVAVGIDFGKSHIRVIVRDIAGVKERVKEEEGEVDVPREAARSLSLATKLAETALKKTGFTPEQLVGAYVGVPAPVDALGNISQQTGMPDWRGRNPVDELGKRLQWDTPMHGANDASLGAVAELEWGAAQDCSNAIYLKWSTGIGGGLIVDGELVRGANNLAGEIGHVPVLDTTSSSRCDICKAQCLESVAGGEAITKRLGTDAHNLEGVIKKARTEDDDGPHRQALNAAAECVGAALGPLVSVLNPEIIVVGGAFSRQAGDFKLIADGMHVGLERTVFPDAALAGLTLDVGSQTGEAAALGGVALALRDHLRQFLFEQI